MNRWLIGLVCVVPMFMTGNMNSLSWWMGTILITTIGLMVLDEDEE